MFVVFFLDSKNTYNVYQIQTDKVCDTANVISMAICHTGGRYFNETFRDLFFPCCDNAWAFKTQIYISSWLAAEIYVSQSILVVNLLL